MSVLAAFGKDRQLVGTATDLGPDRLPLNTPDSCLVSTLQNFDEDIIEYVLHFEIIICLFANDIQRSKSF